jgi:DNA end-binding protein Ku
MAPRANWKGFLKLSLVSCSIGLVQATSNRERIRFNIINRETGNRVRHRQIDAETGEEVPEEDRVKGYKVADGSYVLLEPDELDEVALESTHTIEIDSFVPRKEIDEIYLDSPYFLFPEDDVGAEAFAVIRDAMSATSLVGLARVVLYNHEHLLMLEPLGKGIKATTLHQEEEILDAKDYFSEIDDVKVPKDMLELAEHILKTKRGHFDPSKFSDRYEDALKELIKAKQAGKAPPTAPPRPSNVINLMDALRRSVRSDRGGSGGNSAQRGKGRAQRADPAVRKRGAAKGKRLKRAS